MSWRAVDRLILKRIAALGDNGQNNCFSVGRKSWEGTLQVTHIPGKLMHYLVGREVPYLEEVK